LQFRPDAQQGLAVGLLALEFALFDFQIGAEFLGGVGGSGSGQSALFDFQILEALVTLLAGGFFLTEQIQIGGDGAKSFRQLGQAGEFLFGLVGIGGLGEDLIGE
jgi:hypothetical protein